MRLTNELLGLAAVSPLVHFESCMKIKNKENKIVRPTANVFQRRMFEAYETLLPLSQEFGIQIRLLGLKIRQCGGTTCSAHMTYHHCQRFRTDAVVIANVNPNAAEMLEKIKFFHQVDAFPWNNRLDPLTKKLEWQNGSRCEITSAETMNMGISRTRQFGLFSEACKYPRGGVKDDKRIMASALPSLSGKGTVGIAESTPEGASGWFYDQWQKALTLDEFLAELKKGNLNPGNGWVKVFAGWFEFEENVKEVTDEERRKIDATLSQREIEGREKYGWTHEQMAWRRDKIDSECGGSEDLFDEYYPEDDISCFLSSGRPRFDARAVARQLRLTVGNIWEEGTLDLQPNNRVTWNPNTSGHAPIKILELPRPNCRYIVWCDPATGEDQTESSDPDRHSIGVLKCGYTDDDGTEQPDKVVARVKAPFFGEANEVAEYIEALSRLYGNAIVVLEVNMGLHIMEHLKLRGVPLYRRKVIDPNDRTSDKYMFGWKLKDADQRKAVIDCLAIAILYGTVDLSDPHIVKECQTFIVSKNGRAEARPGTHDDDVLGVGMALYCKGSATLYRGPRRRRQKPADWNQWKRN